jgi:hypothetical protein
MVQTLNWEEVSLSLYWTGASWESHLSCTLGSCYKLFIVWREPPGSQRSSDPEEETLGQAPREGTGQRPENLTGHAFIHICSKHVLKCAMCWAISKRCLNETLSWSLGIGHTCNFI